VGCWAAESGWWVVCKQISYYPSVFGIKKTQYKHNHLENQSDSGRPVDPRKQEALLSKQVCNGHQQLGDCEKQKINNKDKMLAERTGLDATVY